MGGGSKDMSSFVTVSSIFNVSVVGVMPMHWASVFLLGQTVSISHCGFATDLWIGQLVGSMQACNFCAAIDRARDIISTALCSWSDSGRNIYFLGAFLSLASKALARARSFFGFIRTLMLIVILFSMTIRWHIFLLPFYFADFICFFSRIMLLSHSITPSIILWLWN